MTPFGWRFIGTLFGVLMVPLMYMFIKNLFGKRPVAVIGTLLFSFDFMHYVQTRIATIDTYGVFFTILMYWSMYRFISTDFEDRAYKQIVPLALCGISFGLGIASKWTGFYAATGLVALYVIYIVRQGKRMSSEGKFGDFAVRLTLILIASITFFWRCRLSSTTSAISRMPPVWARPCPRRSCGKTRSGCSNTMPAWMPIIHMRRGGICGWSMPARYSITLSTRPRAIACRSGHSSIPWSAGQALPL